MKRKSSRGFTLIEIILAVAIFSIISVGFFSMFSIVFINNYKSSALTENAFHAQQQIEDKIAVVKSTLEEGNTPSGYTSSSVKLFSGSNQRTVTVYHVTQTNTTGITLETFIALNRPPILQTPTITSPVTIAISSNSVKQDYPNIGMPSLSADLGNELLVDNPGLLIRYLYYWYLSDVGDYIPNSPPTFPDKYSIITDHTSRLISSIPASYAGRFLKLVVTPVGEKGQMGTSVESNTIFISPLTLNTNMVLHLDASYINKDDAAQVRNATVSGKVYSYIKNWYDINSIGVNLLQSTPAAQPIVYQYAVGSGTTEHMVLASTGISGVSGLNMLSATSPAVSSKLNMTVYFAAKFDDTIPNNTVIFQSRASANSTTGNKWMLGTSSTGSLVLTRYLDGTTTAKTWTLNSTGTFKDGTWKVFKLEIFSDRLAIEINGVDAGSLSFASTTQTMYLTDFKINFNYSLALGEVLVYDTIHASGSSNSTNIYSYLNAKFKP